ncbi:MAG: hypothetical protein KAH32_02905 [Chlamydiia bacterium]|nr:hypothetical protein [Chlamydiia bacterium]
MWIIYFSLSLISCSFAHEYSIKGSGGPIYSSSKGFGISEAKVGSVGYESNIQMSYGRVGFLIYASEQSGRINRVNTIAYFLYGRENNIDNMNSVPRKIYEKTSNDFQIKDINFGYNISGDHLDVILGYGEHKLSVAYNPIIAYGVNESTLKENEFIIDFSRWTSRYIYLDIEKITDYHLSDRAIFSFMYGIGASLVFIGNNSILARSSSTKKTESSYSLFNSFQKIQFRAQSKLKMIVLGDSDSNMFIYLNSMTRKYIDLGSSVYKDGLLLESIDVNTRSFSFGIGLQLLL